MSRQPPAWAAAYVGVPFKELGRGHEGVDCWGLLQLIYREQAGLEMPDHLGGYNSTKDGAAVAAAIAENGPHSDDWVEVPEGQERLFDAVHMNGYFKDEQRRTQVAAMHCGLVLAPGLLIHVERGINASTAEYRRDLRTKDRIVGFHRPAALHVEAPT